MNSKNNLTRSRSPKRKQDIDFITLIDAADQNSLEEAGLPDDYVRGTVFSDNWMPIQQRDWDREYIDMVMGRSVYDTLPAAARHDESMPEGLKRIPPQIVAEPDILDRDMIIDKFVKEAMNQPDRVNDLDAGFFRKRPPLKRKVVSSYRRPAAPRQQVQPKPAPENTQNDVDNDTGGSWLARILVNSTRNDADGLTTLRKIYPDARPYGDDNYIFTHPDTGRPTLLDPPGLDWGEIADNSRLITEILGGTAGAIVGGPVISALSAEGVGQLHDYVLKGLGREDSRSNQQRIQDALINAGLNFGGSRVVSAGKRAADNILRRDMPAVPETTKSFGKELGSNIAATGILQGLDGLKRWIHE